MSQSAHKVAIVSDSASDIPPQLAKELGITIVPVIVSFNEESFKVGEEISMDEFWKRLTAPGAPFPKTAAPSAAAFTAAYDRAFAEGAQRRQSGKQRGPVGFAEVHNIHLTNSGGDGITARSSSADCEGLFTSGPPPAVPCSIADD